MIVHFKRVTIIGVGLIGGSLAMALREKGIADRIVGVGRGEANLKAAKELGVIDESTHDLIDGVKGADLVLVATPVASVPGIVKKIASHLKKNTIVTDVGSVKRAIIDGLEDVTNKGVLFVPGHPIAGTENSGVKAAFPTLFEDKVCILTPTKRTDMKALGIIETLWETVGSEVVIMDPVCHDKVLAAVSHLPHVIAYSLVNTVAGMKGFQEDFRKYTAGGFKDITRTASSPPEMWRDICVMNKDAILDMIGQFQARLECLRVLIENEDIEGLLSDFGKAKYVRDSLKNGKK